MLLKKGSKGAEVKQLQQMLGLTADGDFGPKTEEAVKQWQKDHGLTVDGIVGDKTWATVMSGSGDNIGIIYDPLKVHVTKLVRTPKYIAIHYTAGGSSKPGSAKAVKKVFESRQASADFAVDDRDIVQFNPDIKNYYCWAVGDKKNPYSKGGSFNGKATNRNTISIEMCSNLKKGTSAAAPNHEGWTLTEETINNTLRLTRYLMEKYNIDKDHVIRHYDVTGKTCPGVLGWNNELIYDVNSKMTNKLNNSEEWKKFKERL